MELTGKLTWLILSTCAILGQAQCEGGNEVANIHTLIAGMQVLRTVAVSQIAHFLDIPASRLSSPTLSLAATKGTKTALKQALHTTCRIHGQIQSVVDLRQEMMDDVEVNALLVVLKHTQNDSCHWVANIIAKDYSICSEENISSICFQWEALVIAEEAENDLQAYVEETKVTVDEWLNKNIRRVNPHVISETIMSYF